MNLERIAMQRADEQMASEAWRKPDPEPVVVKVRRDVDGTKRCGRCERGLTPRNTSGLCHGCWGKLSPKRRREWVAAYAALGATEGRAA